jgi:hypothetical protein
MAGNILSGSGVMVAADDPISAAARIFTAQRDLMPRSGWISLPELLSCFTSA